MDEFYEGLFLLTTRMLQQVYRGWCFNFFESLREAMDRMLQEDIDSARRILHHVPDMHGDFKAAYESIVGEGKRYVPKQNAYRRPAFLCRGVW